MSDVARPEQSREHALSPVAAVRLVAGRELSTRLRSKAFLVGTALLVALVVVLSLVVTLVNHDTSTKIGLPPSSTALAGPLVASAKSVGTTVKTSSVPSEAAGRSLVRDGKLDAVVTLDNGRVQAVVKRDVPDPLRHSLDVLAGQVAFNAEISRLGGDPAQVQTALSTASVKVASLLPPKTYDGEQLALGIAVGILIYLALLTTGQLVAQGVVEEKATRVVELLLATIRPWQLMAGKVVGIGILGLIQVAVVSGFGLGAALATGALSLSLSAAGGTIAWLVVWFVLGFLMYALAFAAAAALVSRQEDAQSVVLPIMMLLIVGYVIGVSVLPADPGSGFVEVLSVIAVFAPTLMPMRLAIGGVPWWETALAIALAIAMIPLLTAIGGRIYRNAVVRSGARVRLRDALRAQ